MRSKHLAIVLNVLLPGTGLVVLRRSWLGLVTAVLFGVLLQMGIWGTWLIPAVVPWWFSLSAWIGSGMVYLGSQIMLIRQWQFTFSPDVRAEFVRLLEQADGAWETGDLKTVRQILVVARSLDDEDLGVSVRWARLLEREGRVRAARGAWLRVIKLDPASGASDQARRALAATSDK